MPAATRPEATVGPVAVPVPKGKPVLQLSGAVSNHNKGTSLAFDQPTLDARATVTSTLDEPFVNKPVKFTGIPMSDLLGRAGISPEAKMVNLHAVDDYTINLAVGDITAPGVLLATKIDGQAIPVGKGGPIRLVWPPESQTGKNKRLWIWSVNEITVR